MSEFPLSFGTTKCPICGAPHQTCKGENEVFVGRPIDLAAFVERPEGTTALRAKEQIWVERNDGMGTKTLLYNTGDLIRATDAEALGLTAGTVKPTFADKAKRGPDGEAESTTAKVPRDKALRGPREEPKEE